MRTYAGEALIVAALFWLLLGPSWSIEWQKKMALYLGLVEDEEPATPITMASSTHPSDCTYCQAHEGRWHPPSHRYTRSVNPFAWSQQALSHNPPRLVMDGLGNHWKWNSDVGYIQLITRSRHEQPAQPTLRALEELVGPVREWVAK